MVERYSILEPAVPNQNGNMTYVVVYREKRMGRAVMAPYCKLAPMGLGLWYYSELRRSSIITVTESTATIGYVQSVAVKSSRRSGCRSGLGGRRKEEAQEFRLF